MLKNVTLAIRSLNMSKGEGGGGGLGVIFPPCKTYAKMSKQIPDLDLSVQLWSRYEITQIIM